MDQIHDKAELLEQIQISRDLLAEVREQLAHVFIGQQELVHQVLCALIADGHILVESLPGLGKTLLVKTLGKLLGLEYRRIQFTPDLMPTDITGSHIFNMAEKQFEFQPGPIFTQFLLADELNRSPAKTHAALLEAMGERQVTLDNHSYPLRPPFLVMATQNPIESEGTYNLPEAALDRFLVKVVIDYPHEKEEHNILRLYLNNQYIEERIEHEVETVLTAKNLLAIQRLACQIHVEESIISYITSIVRATRHNSYLYLGASPRASVALLKIARAAALLAGRAYLVPDDVAENVLAILRHRVILAPEAEIEGRNVDDVLKESLAGVPVPRPTNEPAALS